MDLDQDKYQASLANASLEKPFDVGTLRKLIQELVPKTKTQKLSGFLNLPKMPEFTDQAGKKPTATPAPAAKEESKDWGMDSFEPPTGLLALADDDEFKQVPIAQPKNESPKNDQELIKDDSDDKAWQRTDLSRFKIQLDEQNENDLPVDYVVPNTAVHTRKPIKTPVANAKPAAVAVDDDDLDLDIPSQSSLPNLNAKKVAETAAVSAPTSPLSEAQLEKLIREQSQAVIEAVVWKVVPDLAARIIERELERLLNEKLP